jgi:TFIIF-interacting CTD phosphatase-like protein
LNHLGRDLSKVIMIDNNPEYFELNKENGLTIKTWENDIFDQQLYGLRYLLSAIYQADVDDVRTVIPKITSLVSLKRINNEKNPYMNVDINVFFK